MTATTRPPSPTHLLRSHVAPISALYITDDNERIYSGDASGLAVVTSTRSLRVIISWKAHTDGLLGIQEWESQVLTHGRDNKLHVWMRVDEPSMRLGGSAALPDLPTPTLCYSMDVNALNFCRFSLMPLTLPEATSSSQANQSCALIALPNLVESSLADIWLLPECERLHAAIGKSVKGVQDTSEFQSGSRGAGTTGIIMSMHLFRAHDSPDSVLGQHTEMRLLCAYENGGVMLWKFSRSDKRTSVEGIGWEAVFTVKLHVESVMSMSVSRDHKFALTVSADHLIGKYDLEASEKSGFSPRAHCVAHRTKHPGNSTIAIHSDGRVCAAGGWDGKIRLFTTRTLKSLGTLDYHKDGCQVALFANPLLAVHGHTDDDDDDDIDEDEKVERSRWLVGGGKDCRVSIWALKDFEKK